MSVSALLDRLRQHPQDVAFNDVMDVIAAHYDYRPTGFRNGELMNTAGQNEGSCKVFAFARLHDLDEAQTLACFGDYYRQDVLQHPEGSDHANIRSFMIHGGDGITFEGDALAPKSTVSPCHHHDQAK